MPKRTVWYDARNLKNEQAILPLIYNLNFEHIIIDVDMLETIKTPRKISLIVNIDTEEQLDKVPGDAVLLFRDAELLEKARASGFKTAFWKRIDSREAMEEAWRIGCKSDYLISELISDTNIPLELLIARLQDKATELLKVVKNRQEAEIAFGVMEVGSDGVVIATENPDEILGVNSLMVKEESGKLQLVKGRVVDVRHIGMGCRACIDTTSILKENEGMLIGSTSRGGILISSETHFLPYMELRPFRVNAGAVHSYVWAPEDATAYLTELKGGSKVLCVDTEGNTRTVSVGRVKIETRPLLKIEVEAENTNVNCIVQDDWHIRIFGGDGQVLNASEIKPGDELLTYICQGGRHVGIKIDEMLEEK